LVVSAKGLNHSTIKHVKLYRLKTVERYIQECLTD